MDVGINKLLFGLRMGADLGEVMDRKKELNRKITVPRPVNNQIPVKKFIRYGLTINYYLFFCAYPVNKLNLIKITVKYTLLFK